MVEPEGLGWRLTARLMDDVIYAQASVTQFLFHIYFIPSYLFIYLYSAFQLQSMNNAARSIAQKDVRASTLQ